MPRSRVARMENVGERASGGKMHYRAIADNETRRGCMRLALLLPARRISRLRSGRAREREKSLLFVAVERRERSAEANKSSACPALAVTRFSRNYRFRNAAAMEERSGRTRRTDSAMNRCGGEVSV